MSGALPAGWARSPLGEVSDVQLGKMLDRKKTDGSPRPYLRNVNVRWGRIETDDLLSMPFRERELDRYSVLPGDVLVCEGGEPGRAAVWKRSDLAVMYQKALHRVRFQGGILPDWLVYLLEHDGSNGILAKHFTGTTIGHFPREALIEYELKLAPLPEQRRIVAAFESYFTRLDDAVATLERVQRNLTRYRASVLKAAVEGRLVPTEAELARAEGRSYESASELLNRVLEERRKRWEQSGKKGKYEEPAPPDTTGLPELPEGWCWASLGQLLQSPLINGRSVPDGDENGFPVLRLTALRNGQIDLSQRKNGAWRPHEAAPFLVMKGDFLVSRGNGSIRLVGRGGLVVITPPPIAFPDTLIRIRVAVEHFGARLLTSLWNSELIRLHIEKRAKTTAGIHKVNQADLEMTPIPLPPRVEQDRLTVELERLSSVIAATVSLVSGQLIRASRLRQSILKWAFEGKLVDQDPSDEPASVLLERIRADRALTPPAPSLQKRGFRKKKAR